MSFTETQIRTLRKGLKQVFADLGIKQHMKLVKTSKKSVSLYIDFPECSARRVRISSHKPVVQQKVYINIYENPELLIKT